MSKPTRPKPPPAPVQGTANRTPIQQKRTAPVAPPVYRPQPTPKVLQRKEATAQPQTKGTTKGTPSPPPAYRPRPASRVTQMKTAPNASQLTGAKVARPAVNKHARTQAPRDTRATASAHLRAHRPAVIQRALESAAAAPAPAPVAPEITVRFSKRVRDPTDVHATKHFNDPYRQERLVTVKQPTGKIIERMVKRLQFVNINGKYVTHEYDDLEQVPEMVDVQMIKSFVYNKATLWQDNMPSKSDNISYFPHTWNIQKLLNVLTAELKNGSKKLKQGQKGVNSTDFTLNVPVPHAAWTIHVAIQPDSDEADNTGFTVSQAYPNV